MSSRIPVTLSMHPDQLARLDQIAADLDRSRSWVASRALGAFLAIADTPSPASGVVTGVQAEPPGAGVRHSSDPRLAPSAEKPMLDTPTGTSKAAMNATQGLHCQTMVRTIETAKRQAAQVSDGQDAALTRSMDYLKKLGKS